MSVKVRYNGLEVDGNLVPLNSGSVQYWRLDPDLWSGILSRVKDLGFEIIETYVPWSVHEISQGNFDFGRTDPAKDLERFIELANEKGLKVLVRPGPHINSELSDYGFPVRVLADPDIQARGSDGGPVLLNVLVSSLPIPSYAQEKLFLEYEPFLAALAPILKRHMFPHGPIVAVQVDNETGYFFHTRTYDLDYSVASIDLYRHYLEVKYRDLGSLNKAYGVKHAQFSDVEPPRGGAVMEQSDLPRHLDWVEYKEYQIQWALSRLAELFRSKGLDDVPFFQNFFAPWTTPYNIPELEKDSGIEFCGLDAYPRSDCGDTVDQARYLSNSSKLPYIPEFGAGYWLHSEPAGDVDFKANILAPFMGGARGVNFYMTVERERWTGSPITRHGKFRTEIADVYRQFNQFSRDLEWHKATPQNQAVVLYSREAQQLKACFERGGRFPMDLGTPEALFKLDSPVDLFGKGDAGHQVVLDFFDQAKVYLKQRQLSYSLGDTGISGEKLRKHQVVFLASWGLLDEAAARRLKSYVESGGMLVLGPWRPTLNTRFEALKSWSEFEFKPGEVELVNDGRVLMLESFDEKVVARALRKAKIEAETTLSDNTLELALHKLGGRQILFVRNPGDEVKPTTVFREGKFVLKPLWSSDKFLGGVEEREVTLQAREIKVWEVIPC